MAPIDPNELLKAFKPLLTKNGGIKNCEEVPRLAGLMRKYSKKLVSRCTYCNILLATENDVLEMFLMKDGWDIINGWLKDAKRDNNVTFLNELLKLLDHCPVTVGRLKENDTAKVVKNLNKHEVEYISDKSKTLVTKWTNLIKSVDDDQQISKEKKKRKINHDKHYDNENKNNTNTKQNHKKLKKDDNIETKLFDSADTILIKSIPNVIINNNSNTNSNNISNNNNNTSLNVSTSNNNENNVEKLEIRPKTAIIRLGKSRSVGVIETNTNPLIKVNDKKSNDKPLNKTLSVINKSQSQTSSTVSQTPLLAGSLNKSKTNENIGIKIIDPLPNIPPNITNNKVQSPKIKESASFMDSLTMSSELLLKKKKRRLSGTSTGKDGAKSPDLNDDSVDEEEDNENNESLISNESENIDETQLEKQILPEPIGDTFHSGISISEQMDLDQSNSNSNSNSGSTIIRSNSLTLSSNIHLSALSTNIITVGEGINKRVVKSILSYGRHYAFKKDKKSVRWHADDKLTRVKYFECDENERINVFKQNNFGENRALDIQHERQLLTQSRLPPERAPLELMPWRLCLFDLPLGLFIEKGKQSREKTIQEERQKTILPAFHPPNHAPDYPQEPDAFEVHAIAGECPKMIPLEDENNKISDYSNMELPRPVLEDPTHSNYNQFHSQPSTNQRNFQTFTPFLDPNVAATNTNFADYNTNQAANSLNINNNLNLQNRQRQNNNRLSHNNNNNQDRRNNSSNNNNQQNQNRGICRNFAKTGNCKYGAKCSFLHSQPNTNNSSSSNNNNRENRDRDRDSRNRNRRNRNNNTSSSSGGSSGNSSRWDDNWTSSSDWPSNDNSNNNSNNNNSTDMDWN